MEYFWNEQSLQQNALAPAGPVSVRRAFKSLGKSWPLKPENRRKAGSSAASTRRISPQHALQPKEMTEKARFSQSTEILVP